jgi:multidrug efflux pump subunit AcrA (membrane-fusion protein)
VSIGTNLPTHARHIVVVTPSPVFAGYRRFTTTAPTRAPTPDRAGQGQPSARSSPSADAPDPSGSAGAATPASGGPARHISLPEEDLPAPRRRTGLVRVLALLVVLLVVGAAGTAVGYHFWYESTYFVVTDNAQVTGDLIQVGSLNAGRIVAARFEVGQPVQSGQEMAVVRIPQELEMPMGGTMVLEEPSAGDRLASVRAPFSGLVVARLSHVGGTVSAGQPIYAIVDPNQVWVRANIEETKLARVQPGHAVDVYMDALGYAFEGRVMAITPASAATFSLLPSQNASGNFVKVTQLVPIKIQVNTGDQILPLGTSATVRIKVREPGGGVPWNP